jgi:hypothetical protein
MFETIISDFSNFLIRLESNIGKKVTAALVGIFIFGCALLYGHFSITPQFHGIQFSLLSENPFDFSYNNPIRYRILAPLLGYFTYLRGEYFFILPLIFCYLLISSIYYYYRSKKFSPVDSFVFVCLLSFSCVILIPIFAPGYTDIVTYYFIFLAFTRIKKLNPSALCFSLALLNHESALFLLPGLILYSLAENNIKGKGVFRTIMFYMLACFPHFIYRYFVNQHIQPLYNFEFYFSEGNIHTVLNGLFPNILPAIFYAFKLIWIFPVIYIYLLLAKKKFRDLVVIITILGGAFAQIIIAYDYTRMLVLAFPAILVSAEYISETYPKKFLTFSLIVILINLLITPYQYNFDGAVKIVMNKSFIQENEKSAIVLNSSKYARISHESDSKFSGN